eukprot:1805429-Pleurochrysis_carterae.AAC.3
MPVLADENETGPYKAEKSLSSSRVQRTGKTEQAREAVPIDAPSAAGRARQTCTSPWWCHSPQ